MPGSLLSQNSFLNAGSVPACWVIRYCSGVSRETASGSLRWVSATSAPSLMAPPAGCGRAGRHECNRALASAISCLPPAGLRRPGLMRTWLVGAEPRRPVGRGPERIDQQPVIPEPVDAGEEQVQLVERLALQPPGQARQIVVGVPAHIPGGRVLLQRIPQPGRGGIEVYQPHDSDLVRDGIAPLAQFCLRPSVLSRALQLGVVIRG